MKRSRNGFTLAEVLITLGIIGVVAALTIPILMANYQKVQEVAGLKKAYAEITEALRLMANDHGCSDDLRCTNLFTGYSSIKGASNVLGGEMVKYLKVSKNCGQDQSAKCFSDDYSQNYDGSGYRYNFNTGNTANYNFITADGFSIALQDNNDNCSYNWANGETNYNISKVCGQVEIDVNGPKGPNSEGRDMFLFYITNGKGPAIYPWGGSEFENSGSWWGMNGLCSPSRLSGSICTGRIMEQGWQMLY